MSVILTNNATSRLGSSLTTGATSLSVTAGEGSRFPSPSGDQWFPVSLIKTTGSIEIVRCTARSGDVLTITRSQEGTAAQAFSAGDRAELRLTQAVITEIQAAIDTLSTAALLDANNLSDLLDPAAARTNLALGNAAQSTIQSSKIDVTAGSLMIVGAHGLGAAVTALTVAAMDLNASVVGSFSEVSGTNGQAATYNWPALVTADGADVNTPVRLEVQTYGSTLYRVQFAAFTLAAPAAVTGRIYKRVMINGTWQAWGYDRMAQATETAIGALMIATQAVNDAGTDDLTAVTPKKQRNGFSAVWGTTGYIALPTWLGSGIIQWGRGTVRVALTFPLAFPTAYYVAQAIRFSNAGNSSQALWISAITNNGLTVGETGNGTSNDSMFYVAIGK